MKKIYLSVFLLVSSISLLSAQTLVSDFETFSLTADSYDNGSFGNPDFLEYDVLYENNYDTTWQSWSGFSISTMTDTLTPGWSNQYSAYTGGGFNSSTYGVYYPFLGEGIQLFAESSEPLSLMITNTTYAALSMRDGDGYGKKFGDTLNADGVVDGTNGGDFFKVWIIGSYSGFKTDSIEFYLADYRFAEDSLDYIIDEWVELDLTPIGFVDRIDFRFESSDTNEYGIRTPMYFAMDDFTYNAYAGLKETDLNLSVFPNPMSDILYVSGDHGTIEISDMSGNILRSMTVNESQSIDVSDFPYGIYLMKLSNSKGSAVRKLVKH